LDLENKFRLSPADFKRYETNALNLMICDRILQGSGYNREWRAIRDGQYVLKPYSFGAESLRKSQPDSGIDLSADMQSAEGDPPTVQHNGSDCSDSTKDAAARIPGTLTYLDFICTSTVISILRVMY
jgi:hypothetical protein